LLPVGERVDAHAASRPARATLAGRDVVLAPFDAARHGADLFALAGGRDQDALWTYMHHGPFADRCAFDAWLAANERSEDPLYFAVVSRAHQRAVGCASLMRIDPANRVIEVGGILYTSLLQRTRGGTEAMYLLARHVFEDLGYRRYEWKCHALNAASRAAALRLGFAFEGVFRQHQIVKGRNRDTAWFSMLDREWPDRKKRLERWLVAANFDHTGRQRTSLRGQDDANS
jgi:RimJ/RimL family protein N-acetyltransferase